MAVFPELTLSGYSIDDILLSGQPARRRRGRARRRGRRFGRLAPGADRRRAAAASAPHLQHRSGDPPREGAGRGGEVLPANVSRVLRATPDGCRRRHGRDDPFLGSDVPFGPGLLFAADDVPGLVLHVEICEDMFVPVPPSAQAALAGATVLANLSGSPITIGRAEDRALLARSASARCLAATTPPPVKASPAPTWPGTARP